MSREPDPSRRRIGLLIGAAAFTIGGIGSLAHSQTATGVMFLLLALIFSAVALRER